MIFHTQLLPLVLKPEYGDLGSCSCGDKLTYMHAFDHQIKCQKSSTEANYLETWVLHS